MEAQAGPAPWPTRLPRVTVVSVSLPSAAAVGSAQPGVIPVPTDQGVTRPLGASVPSPVRGRASGPSLPALGPGGTNQHPRSPPLRGWPLSSSSPTMQGSGPLEGRGAPSSPPPTLPSCCSCPPGGGGTVQPGWSMPGWPTFRAAELRNPTQRVAEPRLHGQRREARAAHPSWGGSGPPRAPAQDPAGLAASLCHPFTGVGPGARFQSPLNPRLGTHVPPGVTRRRGRACADAGGGWLLAPLSSLLLPQ